MLHGGKHKLLFWPTQTENRPSFHPRWLFYIEGSLTIFVALCAFFILPDFPHNTSWLSDQERKLAIFRMREDTSTSDTDTASQSSGLWLALSDWKVWWFTVAVTAQISALSFNLYFPTLTATMGFGTTVSLLLCAPPFIVAAIFAFLYSRYDVRHMRCGCGLGELMLPPGSQIELASGLYS
jgi:hypothetical protein